MLAGSDVPSGTALSMLTGQERCKWGLDLLIATAWLLGCGGRLSDETIIAGDSRDAGGHDDVRDTGGDDAAALREASLSCQAPLPIITDCTCNAWADDADPCWTPVGSGWRLYRDPECFHAVSVAAPAAYRSDASAGIDFATSRLLEWCATEGGCATRPLVETAALCEGTATLRIGFEHCAGCSTQKLNCVRAVVPSDVPVTAEAIATECVGAPY
jgi:hypothetical protein